MGDSDSYIVAGGVTGVGMPISILAAGNMEEDSLAVKADWWLKGAAISRKGTGFKHISDSKFIRARFELL